MRGKVIVLGLPWLVMTASAASGSDYCVRNGIEKFTAAECAALFADAAKPKPKATAVALKPLTTNASTDAPQAPPPATTQDSSASWIANHVFLRRSLKDLGSFQTPSALDKATGAELSWTRDGVELNRSWSTQGFLGVGFSGWGEGGDAIQRYMVGAYVEWNRLSNSKLQKKDIDDVVYGLRSEVGAPFAGATHYFDVSGEIVSNFEGATRNWKLGLEYTPVGLPVPPEWGQNTIFSYLGAPLRLGEWHVLTVSPKLIGEYRGSLDGSKDPLFFHRNEVARAGPAVKVSLVPYLFATNAPSAVTRTSFQLYYGYFYDFLSRAQYRFLDTSATYNLDDAGNFAVTFSYSRGELDTTGQKVDLAKLSLSAKFGGPEKTVPVP